ncbi:PQQ-binding-like beta-propeller repeat protein [Thalassomonas viridans]|uniref:PQQ-binding-like beta-propeller repeat protein n=1 Tax=Thalassomonas viridans TaxID=137584 RepID=A0AAE9Z0A5_9GAMM|nr:PQQ-binding-like beta-propeller repeat protein [Thalassomonas viridans]WDE04461.1 PQQ-binding-like beta-propeller repeat protein [Thalassomonas viridans]
MENNTDPEVTLTHPPSSTQVSSGAKVTVAAKATDRDSVRDNQLDKIVLYKGGATGAGSGFHICSSTPCETKLTVSQSTYVWAEAYDKNGGKDIWPQRRKITVETNNPPKITSFFVSPGSMLTTESATVTAAATDDKGLQSFQLCYGSAGVDTGSCSKSFGSCTTGASASCRGTLSGLEAGTYTVYTRAVDSDGKPAVQTKSLKVYNGLTVRLSSPGAGASYNSGQSVTMTANVSARGANFGLKTVEFFANNVPAGTAYVNSCSNFNSKNVVKSTSFTVSQSKQYTLYARATDCSGNISNSGPVIISVKRPKPSFAPTVTGFSPASPVTTPNYIVYASTFSGADQYRLYETGDNGIEKALPDSVNGQWHINKSYKDNGSYTYCARAWNSAGWGPKGSGTQCKTMTLAIAEALPTAPKFNAIALQQAGAYTLNWTGNDASSSRFELYGSPGDLSNANWQLLDIGSDTATGYLQSAPALGNYSYQLKACNSENKCIIGQQLTINHMAPLLQNAEFNSACGTDCITLTGLALTTDSRVTVQLRNSAVTYVFSGSDLSAPAANTLNVQTNNAVHQALTQGGISVRIANSVANAPASVMVLDETPEQARIDLINHAPTISENGTIYAGVGNSIYAIDPQNGSVMPGWPYQTRGEVVAAPTLSQNASEQDLIYVGAKDHNFYALNQAGEKLWITKTRGEIIAQAELDQNNQLYVGSMDQALYALDADTGAIQWQYPLPVGISQKPVLYGNGLMYVTTEDQQIHIIDRRHLGKYALKWQDLDRSLIRDSLDEVGNWQPLQNQVPEVFFIAKLFYALLDRAPTEKELTFFAYASFMGLAQDEIVNAFLLSDTGQANFPATDSNSDFIDKLYAALFPDHQPALVAGFDQAHWAAQLDAGQTRARVTEALVGSLEYSDRIDNTVLAVLFYFYNDCQLARGCVFDGDSDGDGISDQQEIDNGMDPLDPFDAVVEIPGLTAGAVQDGQFTLSITNTLVGKEKINYYQIFESVEDNGFALIKGDLALAGGATSWPLTKTPGHYHYQVKACVNSLVCSGVSLQVDVFVSALSTAVYQDSSGNLYVRLPASLGGKYFRLTLDHGQWTFTEISQQTWEALDLSITGNTLETGEYTGDNLQDFRIVDGHGAIIVTAVNTSNSTSNNTFTALTNLDWLATGGSVDDEILSEAVPAGSTFNGVIAGSASVSGGAAVYNIPITVAPGRNKMQPSVALNYSSRSGNGIAGVGWSLSAGGSISRCPRTLAQDGDATHLWDRLCLNGQRLVLTNSKDYGTVGATYTTELDSFITVTQTGGNLRSRNSGFEVLLASGSKQFYRQSVTDDERGGSSDWLLDRVEDAGGANHMSYYYQDFGDGEVLLDHILYTGDGNSDGDRKVAFVYEDRAANADTGELTEGQYSSNYAAVGNTRQTQRLRSIASYVGGSKIRQYDLHYRVSGSSGRALLQSVDECINDSCREQTTLSWFDNPVVYQTELLTDSAGLELYPGPTNDLYKLLPHGDRNGDGVRDWPGYFLNAEGDSTSHSLSMTNCDYNRFNYSYVCVEGDFNQDGLTDSWRIENGKLQIGYSTATGTDWRGNTDVTMDGTGMFNADSVFHIADYNLDGWPDILVRRDNDRHPAVYLYLHSQDMDAPFAAASEILVFTHSVTGNGCDNGVGSCNTINDIQAMGDLDGNGIPDFGITSNDPDNKIPSLGISGIRLTKIDTGGRISFTGAGVTFGSPDRAWPFSQFANYSTFFDINSDGLPDWLGWYQNDSNSGGALHYRINRKNGSFGPVTKLGAGLAVKELYVNGDTQNDNDVIVTVPKFVGAMFPMDVNGDGRNELIMPQSIEVEGCHTVRHRGEDKWFCGEALTGHYQQWKGDLVLDTTIPDSYNTNIYRYKAWQFVEDAEGKISIKSIPTNLYGGVNNVQVIDAFGKGLSDLVFNYGCENANCSMKAPPAGSVFSGKAEGIYFNRNYGATTQASPGKGDYQPADMLKQVENGVGLTSRWHYRPLSSGARGDFYDTDHSLLDGEHFHFASSMYAVERFEQSNGIGGFNGKSYQYRGAVYNNQGPGL